MQTNMSPIRIVLMVAAIVITCAIPALAQQPAPASGRIVGRVIAGTTNEGISAVTIQVVGTSLGAISGENGRFVINNVPTGPLKLRASSIGFSTKSVDVAVTGSITEQNIVLETEAVAIDAVEVSVAAERGSLNRALDQQRLSVGVVNAVTAEQISRTPDSDAAQAVQRVSGVTVQDGKFVIVRGLGERYTTTSLNGARVPSAEPEKKLVPLDLFPASLLEQITTSKTFTPDQPGDFSGAQVDIKTREITVGHQQTFSVSTGYNTALTGRTVVAPPQLGMDWLALGARARELSRTQADANGFVRSLRNVWSTQSRAAIPNASLGFTTGGITSLRAKRLSYLFAGTYATAQEIRENETRAQAQSAGESTIEIDRYEGTTSRASVLWGGVANTSVLFGAHSKVAFNNTYNRSADNEARFEAGTSENYGNLPLQITRLRYVERTVRSHQLLGEHEIGEHQRLDWTLTASAVRRAEPDRSEIVYSTDTDPVSGSILAPAWFAGAAEGAVRTYGDLTEEAWEATVHSRRKLGPAAGSLIKVGLLGRLVKRDTENFVYSITAPLLSRTERERTPEEIFASYASDERTVFRIAPLAQGGSYQADDRLVAAYGMVDWAISTTLTLSFGARVEHSAVEINAEPTVGSAIITTPSFTDVLPSVSFTWRPSDSNQMRFSATQTLSRPEYRELAGIQYRDVIGGDNLIGNPELRRTLIRNLDMRYEMYPGAGEVFTVALFAKFFENPIERVYLGTSGTRVVTFMNADGAQNYGVELEGRNQIGPFTIFGNATLMKSEIRIGDSESGASRINDQRPMVGQSLYVVNAGFTYISLAGKLTGSLLYNLSGKRIVNAAESPLPDVYEQGRHSLDMALGAPITSSVTVKLDIKNLLDQPHKIVQGATTRESYNTGRVISLGATWRR